MPNVYALDTDVYVDAGRSRTHREALKEFLGRAGMRVRLASAVLMELHAGVVTRDQRQAVQALDSAYASRGLLVTPGPLAYTQAGRVLSALAAAPAGNRRTLGPSLVMDALLAACCREAGLVLITSNTRDFSAIQRHLRGFRFVPPWPA